MIIKPEWVGGAIQIYELYTLRGFSENDFFVLEIALSRLVPYWATIDYSNNDYYELDFIESFDVSKFFVPNFIFLL